ncbi:hypothetical protein CHS0354_009693 [Potamilus streckersoni]|uniref:Mitochondria-eating protein n=1 Tax=Potamilus streckersoni TaxID=2493646 RepID=A0AAE0VN21_9BIVA|nr:hypothetical protein CHS0354_009693 [Potamilus streckersoni]
MKMNRIAQQKDKQKKEKKIAARNGTKSNPNGPGGQGDVKKGGGQQTTSSSNSNGPGGQGDGKKGGGQQTTSSSNSNGPGGQGDGKKRGGQQTTSSSNPNGQGDGKKGGGQQTTSSSNPKGMAGPGDGNIESGLEPPSSSGADFSIVSFLEELLDVLRNLLENDIQDYSAIDLPSLGSSTKFERVLEDKLKTIHDKAMEMAELCININSEAKYSSVLLKELSDFSIKSTESKRKELSKPPKKVPSTEGEINHLKKHTFQHEENRHSRHFKHLDDNFSSAINVFNKQIEADYTAQLLKTLSEFSQTYDKTSIEKMLCDPPKLFHHVDEEHDKLKDSKYQGETEKNSPTTKIREPSGTIRRIICEMEKKKSSESELQKATIKVENLTQELENLRDQTQKLDYEVNTLRTRLSELVGAKLTNNNPAITDLSDPDRPTKLAEKYSSLYDYQWTDAFAELAKSNPKASEKDLTGQLLNILTDGFNFCEKVRQDQVKKLEQLLLNPAPNTKSGQGSYNNQANDIFTNYLRDAAKVSSIVAGENIYKAFISNTTMNTKFGNLKNLCGAYIEECVRLCWLMQVQTPPVCIDQGTKKGQTFLKDTYREYTSSGTKIAFVVWPALLLHANGPLLMKGVAQGK